MNHDLKTWPKFFTDVWDGRKTFEVRPNDRAFKVGDVVTLREWAPGAGGGYSGREVQVRITYILDGGAWGIADGHCVFAFTVTWHKP